MTFTPAEKKAFWELMDELKFRNDLENCSGPQVLVSIDPECPDEYGPVVGPYPNFDAAWEAAVEWQNELNTDNDGPAFRVFVSKFMQDRGAQVPDHEAALQRIRSLHVVTEAPGGAVTGYCCECASPWPCPTVHIANGWGDGEDDCYATGWCHHAGVKVPQLYEPPLTDDDVDNIVEEEEVVDEAWWLAPGAGRWVRYRHGDQGGEVRSFPRGFDPNGE